MRLMLDAPITDVTVYPDRAQVTRRGSIEVPEAGAHDITLGRLPRTLVSESLRASGRGSAQAQLLGVDLGDEYHAAAPEDDTRALQAEIDRLTREVAALDQRMTMLDQQRHWLNTLGEQAARSLAYGLIRGTAQPEDPARIFALTRDESERLTGTTLDTQADRERVARELEARKRELEAASGSTGPDRYAATIRVQTASAGAIAFEVSYLVYSASWTPRYDARVDTTTDKVSFSQQAQVRQWSGEDWADVRLAISTARPSAALALPDEAPVWYLEQRAPMPPFQPRAYASMRSAHGAGAPGEQAAPMAAMIAPDEASFTDMTIASAEVERAGAAQVFHIGGGSSIPSDGQPHTVGLGDDDLPARLEYVAAPVVADGAHLRAVTLNATGHTLPAGPMHVFHSGATGDEYVGETPLKATAEGAPLKLYLGVNDNITVKRELVERDTDRGNLLQGGVRRTTIGYCLTLANRTDSPQRVVLLDRLPVPKHERIKVKSLEMRPQPSNQTKLDQLTWEFALPPGEERKVEWRILVESPADLDVAGMPS
ncbi:MAG TPA: mucoidy inhibitor MuiA family protein [Ktedonobacterales bacterium]|nr:mucoidy inhibitor MuiA family protein [Ktedonobacterales bacterium]